MVKYVWLEWNGQGWTVNVETWQEGIAPYNTLIPAKNLPDARGMLAAFLRQGYLPAHENRSAEVRV
jgi:hypothetical protein